MKFIVNQRVEVDGCGAFPGLLTTVLIPNVIYECEQESDSKSILKHHENGITTFTSASTQEINQLIDEKIITIL